MELSAPMLMSTMDSSLWLSVCICNVCMLFFIILFLNGMKHVHHFGVYSLCHDSCNMYITVKIEPTMEPTDKSEVYFV